MIVDPQTFAATVITPALQQINLFSPAAQQLLLGTALQESGLATRRQMGGGPALGFFQMEPATANDIWDNYLKFRAPLAALVTGLLSTPAADRVAELETNDSYAAGMARIRYARVPEALPALDDIDAMAAYWKQHYNTPGGAGTADEFVATWTRVMGAAAEAAGV